MYRHMLVRTMLVCLTQAVYTRVHREHRGMQTREGDHEVCVCVCVCVSQGAIYVTDNTAYTWSAAVQETVDATLNRTVSSGTDLHVCVCMCVCASCL